MKNKRYAMLVAAVAFIGFTTLEFSRQNSHRVADKYILLSWRREN